MRTICKNPECPREGKTFTAKRADARYCSVRCRVAVHRRGYRTLFRRRTRWLGKVPKMRDANQALAEQLLKIADTEDGGKPKTGRRYYYLALSHGHIKPDMGASAAAKKEREAAYDRVTKVLGTLRMSGDLPWRMVLDLTREITEWQVYANPREARADMRRTYSEDRWLGQPYFPILIVEKDTLEPICEPMARGWQMKFASSRGYSSLTLQHDVAEALNRRYGETSQTAIIYFISDLDPSGLDLQRAWEEALENFNVVCRFVRIGLTMEQVDAHDLESLAIGVKPSDSRSAAYVEEYGEQCWEADILSEEVIQQALDDGINSWLDDDLWEQREQEIERNRTLL